MPLNALRACAEKMRLLWKPSIRLIGRPRYHLCENGDLDCHPCSPASMRSNRRSNRCAVAFFIAPENSGSLRYSVMAVELTMKTVKYFVTLTAGIALLWSSGPLLAQTASDVAEQELELKKKELELEKSKVEEQKLQQLEVEKAKLDVEKQKLELEQARRDLQVKETQDRLEMQLQGDVFFDTNQAVIKPGAKDTLDKVAIILAAFPTGKVIVTGHADSRGSNAMNLKLSRDRAEAVKTWLLAKTGASSERVIAIGEGEDAPVASDDTPEGRQLNRRVDISVAK
jgi:outer membrane protein OmpA-like peptidoglycan-associated protein